MSSSGRFFPPAPAPGIAGDPGIFGPDSAAWRVARERVILAGGPAALLLQVAHPLVAEGVRAHSGFATDPLQRLRGTLDAVLTVSFGDQAQVRGTAGLVARKHRPVQGTLPAPVGSLPAGTPYRANDPGLSLWVFATLVWSAVEVTEGFLRHVPPEERDAYYRDMTRMAHLFNVPAALLPEDYAGLEGYVTQQIRSTLDVGPAAAVIARQVLDPDPPIVVRPARRLPAVLAAGVLPPALREAYGLRWRRRERVCFAVVRCASQLAVPLLPTRVRYWPHYLVARRRVRATPTG
ncbi:oxygenase MpaB family protein [Arthrobacter sp. B1805]|uniref:oxygenase MpaB family protein n=1 Tax=Arthrobacter sp. B1805 TaxID=2058892 RepID=UPI0015E37527|nr:oxygenase MpaB family protein [Arthrobacter sp. B1805]